MCKLRYIFSNNFSFFQEILAREFLQLKLHIISINCQTLAYMHALFGQGQFVFISIAKAEVYGFVTRFVIRDEKSGDYTKVSVS
jgi:hypothetical protein